MKRGADLRPACVTCQANTYEKLAAELATSAQQLVRDFEEERRAQSEAEAEAAEEELRALAAMHRRREAERREEERRQEAYTEKEKTMLAERATKRKAQKEAEQQSAKEAVATAETAAAQATEAVEQLKQEVADAREGAALMAEAGANDPDMKARAEEIAKRVQELEERLAAAEAARVAALEDAAKAAKAAKEAEDALTKADSEGGEGEGTKVTLDARGCAYGPCVLLWRRLARVLAALCAHAGCGARAAHRDSVLLARASKLWPSTSRSSGAPMRVHPALLGATHRWTRQPSTRELRRRCRGGSCTVRWGSSSMGWISSSARRTSRRATTRPSWR